MDDDDHFGFIKNLLKTHESHMKCGIFILGWYFHSFTGCLKSQVNSHISQYLVKYDDVFGAGIRERKGSICLTCDFS
jgi:hypothetical protein